jgi:hypothetical protein
MFCGLPNLETTQIIKVPTGMEPATHRGDNPKTCEDNGDIAPICASRKIYCTV